MQRKTFLKSAGIFTLAQLSGMTTFNTLNALGNELDSTPRMPALFIGHGSPMNAIENNMYHQSWAALGKTLPTPKAILSISAHWLTQETSVTIAAKPKTIHDFGGFPKILFDQEYPAPGSPDFAALTKQIITHTHVQDDEKWGLDHGTWSILLPMFPLANIPVFQLSLVYAQTTTYHYELGKQLQKLREKGVLIIGSGNLVHNLADLDWNGGNKVYDWALEFDTKMTQWIDEGNNKNILQYQKILGTTADKAHPSNDHLLPLFYILGMQNKKDELTYFNNRFDMGSISMRSFIMK